MSQEIAAQSIPLERFSAFNSIANFENAQRMAKVLSSASIVPQSYRDNLADCVIALEMANRIGANPLAVMQNLYIVHGRPAWSSQFLISCVNASGKFSPLRYRQTGTRGQDDWGCIAWASDKSGEVLESPEVTLGMAKAEGWHGKNGSKWKTMPELMLRYRAATLFARLFAPELTMGLHTDEEIIDIAHIVTDPVRNAKPVGEAPEPQFTKTVAPAIAPKSAPVDDQIPGAEVPQAEPKPAPKPVQNSPERDLKALRLFLKPTGFSELALLNLWRAKGIVDESLGSLDDICEIQPSVIHAAINPFEKTLAALKEVAKGGQ